MERKEPGGIATQLLAMPLEVCSCPLLPLLITAPCIVAGAPQTAQMHHELSVSVRFLLNHLYASTNASTPFGKKLTVVNMLFYFHSLQMPDTRTLTLTLSDGTYKPANTLFTDIATCTASGEYLLLDFPQVCYD